MWFLVRKLLATSKTLVLYIIDALYPNPDLPQPIGAWLSVATHSAVINLSAILPVSERRTDVYGSSFAGRVALSSTVHI